MKTVVIVSAHPDDMEIGMGGTVAKLSEAGAAVYSVILTDGRRSPNPFKWSHEQMVETRKTEAQDAAKYLKIREVIFGDLPDLRSPDHLDRAVSTILEVMHRSSASEIFTLHPELDRHSSHRAAGKATLQAAGKLPITPSIWAYEVWGLFPQWDRLEDITRQIGDKIFAIQQHRSQVATIPYAEGVMGLNRWRAVFADPEQTENRLTYAEAFIALK